MFSIILAASLVAAAPQQDTVPAIITLEDALQIALSESPTVKIADKDIEIKRYAKKGAYASLFPQISANGSFSHTLKKQVMTMDFGGVSQSFEVGRWNTVNGGVTASLPLVNAQLWKSLSISGEDVELAVEKARSSRLDLVTQVKQAYYSVLLAKEVDKVYNGVYDNAVANLDQTQKRFNAQKTSELDLIRAKTAVANAIPNLYSAENSIALALWQLKAVMGVDLDANLDVAGSLMDYSGDMVNDLALLSGDSLEGNTTLRQLAIQAEQLANNIKLQQYANLPSLALSFSHTWNAMEDKYNFSQYEWHPYAYLGLSLSIPIFAGGQRHSAIKQARLQADELDLTRENTERQLRIGIRQFLSTMETAEKSYASAQEALESARKAYDIAAKSYFVGRSTLTDLGDAQLALTQAQLSVSQAVYDFVVAKAGLEQTLGADYNLYEPAK